MEESHNTKLSIAIQQHSRFKIEFTKCFDRQSSRSKAKKQQESTVRPNKAKKNYGKN